MSVNRSAGELELVQLRVPLQRQPNNDFVISILPKSPLSHPLPFPSPAEMVKPTENFDSIETLQPDQYAGMDLEKGWNDYD